MFPTQTLPQTMPPLCPGVTPAGPAPPARTNHSTHDDGAALASAALPNRVSAVPATYVSAAVPAATFPPLCHPTLPPYPPPASADATRVCFHTQTAVCLPTIPQTIHLTVQTGTPVEAQQAAAAPASRSCARRLSNRRRQRCFRIRPTAQRCFRSVILRCRRCAIPPCRQCARHPRIRHIACRRRCCRRAT